MVLLDFLVANPDVAIGVATAVGGWLGLTKKKANTSALKDKLLARLRKEVLDLVDEYVTTAKARAVLDKVVADALDTLGVKRTKLIDALVEPLIEQAMKEFQERVGMLTLKLKLEQLFGEVSKLPEAFGGTKLEDSEKAFRAASNVEVVTEMPK